MQMISYQGALRTLQPIIVPVCDAFRAGLVEATRYHAEREFDRTDDEHFFSHNARRLVWQRLHDRGLQVELDEAGSQMSSLVVFWQDLLLRVLRGRRGDPREDRPRSLGIPGPGQSDRRRRFWRQEPDETLPGLRAVEHLLWVWGDDDGVLTDPMILARPNGSLDNGEHARLSWSGKISESMASMRAEDLDELEPDFMADELGDENTG